MRKRILFVTLVLMLCLIFGSAIWATQLVWTPVLPSFGGPSYNGIWLQAQAEAQKPAEKVKYWWEERDPLKSFQEELERQLLYRLSSKIISEAFGDYSDPIQPGHYEVGNYVVDISKDLTGIRISIIDLTTGNSTSIMIPYY